MRRALCAITVLLTGLVGVGVVVPAEALSAKTVKAAQERLNRLRCHAGPVDGVAGQMTKAATVRFQSRHRLAQTGYLNDRTRQVLHSARANRCDVRPRPTHSGTGRRMILSQRQNWVWLVAAGGRVVAQGGLIDNPGVLDRGRYWTGPKCGRAGRIKNNSDYSGQLKLYNFVRFAPCGMGFHQVPTYRSNGRQIHPNWLLGTNYRESHGCVRVSRLMSERIWDFTVRRTKVVVVRG